MEFPKTVPEFMSQHGQIFIAQLLCDYGVEACEAESCALIMCSIFSGKSFQYLSRHHAWSEREISRGYNLAWRTIENHISSKGPVQLNPL